MKQTTAFSEINFNERARRKMKKNIIRVPEPGYWFVLALDRIGVYRFLIFKRESFFF